MSATNAPGVALLPCPFGCRGKLRSGEPFKSIHLFMPTDAQGCWYASCLECDCDGPPCSTKDEAVAAWNRRDTTHATLRARVETLEKQNAAMQAVVNAASVFENVETDEDDHDGMDEMLELFEAVKRYRAALNATPSQEGA